MIDTTDRRVRKWRLPIVGNFVQCAEASWCRITLNFGPELKLEMHEESQKQFTVTAMRDGLMFLPPSHEPLIRLPHNGQRGPRAAQHRLFADLLLLMVHPALFDEAARRLGHPLDYVREMPAMSLTLDEMGKLLAKGLALAIENQLDHGPAMTEQLAVALAMWIVEHRNDVSHSVEERRFARSALERVLARIEADYDQDLSLQTLADEACMSRYHFARMFKASTGRSPYQFVLQVRIERAKAMLAKGSTGQAASMGTIALDAGFSSHSQFSKVFKRLTGMSPASWLRSTETLTLPSRAGNPDFSGFISPDLPHE